VVVDHYGAGWMRVYNKDPEVPLGGCHHRSVRWRIWFSEHYRLPPRNRHLGPTPSSIKLSLEGVEELERIGCGGGGVDTFHPSIRDRRDRWSGALSQTV